MPKRSSRHSRSKVPSCWAVSVRRRCECTLAEESGVAFLSSFVGCVVARSMLPPVRIRLALLSNPVAFQIALGLHRSRLSGHPRNFRLDCRLAQNKYRCTEETLLGIGGCANRLVRQCVAEGIEQRVRVACEFTLQDGSLLLIQLPIANMPVKAGRLALLQTMHQDAKMLPHLVAHCANHFFVPCGAGVGASNDLH